MSKQRAICLDFEGTLVGEFWPAVARATGIAELMITTQDEPDFNKLMQRRIAILNEHNIKLQDLVKYADDVELLDGAKQFITDLQRHVARIVIVSDFAEDTAKPMLQKFDGLFYCGHRYTADADGTITGYEYRQNDAKPSVVRGLQSMNFEVYAAGDSYNDLTMLHAADKGVLFKSTDAIQAEYPDLKHYDSYDELLDVLTEGVSK